MSQLNITKKTLTEEQKLLISDMGFNATDLLESYYELTPTGSSLSNLVTIEPNSSCGVLFKLPYFNNLASKSAEISFSDTPIQTDFLGNIVSAELTGFSGSSLSDNPRYFYNGIQSIIADFYSADEDYVYLAEMFQAASSEISPHIRIVPFSNLTTQSFEPETAQTIEVLQETANPTVSGRPYVFARKPQSSIDTPSGLNYEWPGAMWGLKMNINKDSEELDKQTSGYMIKNLFYPAVFESLGWNKEVVSNYLSSSFTELTSSLGEISLGGDRSFCIDAGVLQKYKEFSAIPDVIGAPMSKTNPIFFADGYSKDSIDEPVYDFYFSEEVKGGPLNQQVPHPALHREILAYNEKNGLAQNFYTRLDSEGETYKSPGYIVTKEAMKMLYVEFDDGQLDNGLDDVRISHYHPGNQTVETLNLESDIENDSEIRTFTKEKYLIKTVTGDTELRHILCHPNKILPYAEGFDRSVKQALRYFGFVPYGDLSNIGTNQISLEGKRSVVIEDGVVQDYIANMTEDVSRANYNFYISANRSFDHENLGLLALGKANDALARLFNAELLHVEFCVGVDAVDDELEQNKTRLDHNYNYRYILVRK